MGHKPSRERSRPQPQLVANEGLLPTNSFEYYSPTRVVKPNKRNYRSKSMINPMRSSKELPYRYADILKGADSMVDTTSKEKLLDQLYSGVFLNHYTKKYWVEKNSNSNCFILYAREISINHADNNSANYWNWVNHKESSGTMTEVAELKAVCWLEARVTFDSRSLSPGTIYEVYFVVMLKNSAEGWDSPVTFKLVLPSGKIRERKESMIDKVREKWIEIPVGEFVASEKDGGEIEVSLKGSGDSWKQGLVIKAVLIKPMELS